MFDDDGDVGLFAGCMFYFGMFLLVGLGVLIGFVLWG